MNMFILLAYYYFKHYCCISFVSDDELKMGVKRLQFRKPSENLEFQTICNHSSCQKPTMTGLRWLYIIALEITFAKPFRVKYGLWINTPSRKGIAESFLSTKICIPKKTWRRPHMVFIARV